MQIRQKILSLFCLFLLSQWLQSCGEAPVHEESEEPPAQRENLTNVNEGEAVEEQDKTAEEEAFVYTDKRYVLVETLNVRESGTKDASVLYTLGLGDSLDANMSQKGESIEVIWKNKKIVGYMVYARVPQKQAGYVFQPMVGMKAQVGQAKDGIARRKNDAQLEKWEGTYFEVSNLDNGKGWAFYSGYEDCPSSFEVLAGAVPRVYGFSEAYAWPAYHDQFECVGNGTTYNLTSIKDTSLEDVDGIVFHLEDLEGRTEKRMFKDTLINDVKVLREIYYAPGLQRYKKGRVYVPEPGTKHFESIYEESEMDQY